MRQILERSKLMFTGIGFWVGMLCVLCLCLAQTILVSIGNMGVDQTLTTSAPAAFILYAPDNSIPGGILRYIYIFILLLPFSFSYVNERKRNMTHCLQMRMGVRRYYYENLLLCFLGSFFMFFIPFAIQIGLNQVLFNSELIHGFTYNYMANISGDSWSTTLYTRGIPFKWLFINHPQFYNLLYGFFFSALCGIMSMFVYALSFSVKQYAVVLLLPLFVITQIQDKLVAISQELFGSYIELRMEEYVSVLGYRGQCVWYILGLVILFLGATYFLTERQCKGDQLN